MRVDLTRLDPTSPLARRIRAALEIDRACRPTTPSVRPEVADMSEEQVQRAVVAIVAAEALPGTLVFHPANGGHRGKAEAGRFKALGVVAGIPDLVAIAGGRVFGLELKAARGRLSAAQTATAERWRHAGAVYAVAHTVEQAREILVAWGIIGGGKT